jgi:hypothetical protein
MTDLTGVSTRKGFRVVLGPPAAVENSLLATIQRGRQADP